MAKKTDKPKTKREEPVDEPVEELDEFETEVAEAEEQESNVWKPEPGDFIVGILEKVEEKVTPNGTGKLATLTLKNGEVTAVWLQTILENRFEDLRVRSGDRVGIKFLGIPKGKRYNAYVVKVDLKRRKEIISAANAEVDESGDEFEE